MRVASVIAGLSVAFATQAQTSPPKDEFQLRVPSGHIVTVDCNKLGPGRTETYDFWLQLEPKHEGMPRNSAEQNTNPRAIAWLKDHLGQHGIGAGHIQAVMKRCQVMPLANAAEPVQRFK